MRSHAVWAADFAPDHDLWFTAAQLVGRSWARGGERSTAEVLLLIAPLRAAGTVEPEWLIPLPAKSIAHGRSIFGLGLVGPLDDSYPDAA